MSKNEYLKLCFKQFSRGMNFFRFEMFVMMAEYKTAMSNLPAFYYSRNVLHKAARTLSTKSCTNENVRFSPLLYLSTKMEIVLRRNDCISLTIVLRTSSFAALQNTKLQHECFTFIDCFEQLPPTLPLPNGL